MDGMDAQMQSDEEARPPEDTAPVCKPQAMIGATEEFMDFLLVLEKQVWQLHLLRPESEPVGKAMLDLAHIELLAAPVTGRGMAQRINAEELGKLREVEQFLGSGVMRDIEGAFADAGQAPKAPKKNKGAPGEEDKRRSNLKIALGYETSDDDSDVKNAIPVHGQLAKKYLGGNAIGGLEKTVLETVERVRDAVKDVIFYSEPCQLSNF